jgi:hypothetical protein
MINSRNTNYISKISFYRKFLFSISAILIFCNYYYLYLFQFNQGVSSSPGYFSFLKIFGVLSLVLAFFDYRRPSTFHYDEALLIFFVFFSTIWLFIKMIFFEDGSDLYLNFVLSFLPFIFLSLKRNIGGFLYFFEFCFWLLTVQIAVDIYLRYNNISLWDNGAFIGGLGNPSSFGIFSNVVLAYVLLVREKSFSSVFGFFFIGFAIINTKSLFAVFAMFFVIMYFLWNKSKLASILSLVSGTSFFICFIDRIVPEHLMYKISSIYTLLLNSGADGSQSIMIRVAIHEIFYERISSNFLHVFFVGYDDLYYYKADSQFLSFFGSFGVFLSSIFFSAVVFNLIRNRRDTGVEKFFWISMFLFLLMFLTNRVIDYYPMPVLFLVLFFGSNQFRSIKII